MAHAIKRLATENRIMLDADKRVCDYFAEPLDDNLYEWHFTLRGPPVNSKNVPLPYKDGIYHGRLTFPLNYPFEPPDIYFFTPSGRFKVRQKICSTISSFHKELWRPTYDIGLILVALRLFMGQEDEVGIGSLGKTSFTEAAKLEMAAKSWDFVCPDCKQAVRAVWEEHMAPFHGTTAEKLAAVPQLPPGATAAASAAAGSLANGDESAAVQGDDNGKNAAEHEEEETVKVAATASPSNDNDNGEGSKHNSLSAPSSAAADGKPSLFHSPNALDFRAPTECDNNNSSSNAVSGIPTSAMGTPAVRAPTVEEQQRVAEGEKNATTPGTPMREGQRLADNVGDEAHTTTMKTTAAAASASTMCTNGNATAFAAERTPGGKNGSTAPREEEKEKEGQTRQNGESAVMDLARYLQQQEARSATEPAKDDRNGTPTLKATPLQKTEEKSAATDPAHCPPSSSPALNMHEAAVCDARPCRPTAATCKTTVSGQAAPEKPSGLALAGSGASATASEETAPPPLAPPQPAPHEGQQQQQPDHLDENDVQLQLFGAQFDVNPSVFPRIMLVSLAGISFILLRRAVFWYFAISFN